MLLTAPLRADRAGQGEQQRALGKAPQSPSAVLGNSQCVLQLWGAALLTPWLRHSRAHKAGCKCTPVSSHTVHHNCQTTGNAPQAGRCTKLVLDLFLTFLKLWCYETDWWLMAFKRTHRHLTQQSKPIWEGIGSCTSTALYRLSNIFCSRSCSYRAKFISKIGESAFQCTEIKTIRKMKILNILNFVIPYLASKITYTITFTWTMTFWYFIFCPPLCPLQKLKMIIFMMPHYSELTITSR